MIWRLLKSVKRFWDDNWLEFVQVSTFLLVVIGLVIVLPIKIGPARTAIYYCSAAILFGLFPRFRRLRSKDETYLLLSVSFEFGGLFIAPYPIAFSFLQNCTGVGYFFIWLGIVCVAAIPFVIILDLVPLGFRFVRVGDAEGKEAISRFLLVTGMDQTPFEALWVEDEPSLLFAFHDELDWTLYRWDIESTDQSSRRFRVKKLRFGVILIGHYPPLRWVNYHEDHPWLEAMWERYQVDPESPPGSRHKDKALPAYTRQVRRFFTKVLREAHGFPNSKISVFQRFKKRDFVKHPDWVENSLKEILRAIPESARFYRQAREKAVANLLELDPSADIEKTLNESEPVSEHSRDERMKWAREHGRNGASG